MRVQIVEVVNKGKMKSKKIPTTAPKTPIIANSKAETNADRCDDLKCPLTRDAQETHWLKYGWRNGQTAHEERGH